MEMQEVLLLLTLLVRVQLVLLEVEEVLIMLVKTTVQQVAQQDHVAIIF